MVISCLFFTGIQCSCPRYLLLGLAATAHSCEDASLPCPRIFWLIKNMLDTGSIWLHSEWRFVLHAILFCSLTSSSLSCLCSWTRTDRLLHNPLTHSHQCSWLWNRLSIRWGGRWRGWLQGRSHCSVFYYSGCCICGCYCSCWCCFVLGNDHWTHVCITIHACLRLLGISVTRCEIAV